MVADNGGLERYALAYIKKSGSSRNVQGFLHYFNNTRNLTWDEETFARTYKECTRINSSSGHDTRNRNNQYNAGNNTGSQAIYANTRAEGLSFWDCLLLQCWINSLFGGRGHTTVNNITNINNATNHSRKENKKESEDSRKLLALGIVVAVVCVAFHVSMCYF